MCGHGKANSQREAAVLKSKGQTGEQLRDSEVVQYEGSPELDPRLWRQRQAETLKRRKPEEEGERAQ